MRPRTRNVTVGVLLAVALLVALGALPGLLKSGAPYHATATVEGAWPGGADREAVNASTLGDSRFPYMRGALESATPEEPGRSEPYWRGPVGLKEAFTHSPFDELSALEERNPGAATGDGVYVYENDTLYRLAVVRVDG